MSTIGGGVMVKICGITNQQDALAAVEAGASALGFNFYSKSARYIDPEKAAGLAIDLDVLRVGIFVDELPARICEIASYCRLDVVQLHGNEPPETVIPSLRVWKAFRVTEGWTARQTDGYAAEAIVLDGPVPGSGEGFDWAKTRGIQQRLVLAGGLDEKNVAEAIRLTSPWGVDACSGLEKSPGIKDHDKVRRFVAAAKAQNR